MDKPFCDRLTVSSPASHDAALLDVCAEFAVQLDAKPDGPKGRWLLPEGGTFFYQSRGRFAALEASGRALAALRAATLFGDYLGALGALPHRVTRLDATLDIAEPAAPFLRDLYRKGVKGQIRLSRKPVDGTEVVQYLGAPLYPGDMDTGTVYVPMRRFGSKRQYLTAYDKRQERLSKGYPDPGDLLRIEASAARDKGATLADAWDPEPLFYDIVSPDVLDKPAGVPAWVPAVETWTGGGYKPSEPRRRLEWALEGSLGAELLRLASYPGGLTDLQLWLDSVRRGRVLAGVSL